MSIYKKNGSKEELYQMYFIVSTVYWVHKYDKMTKRH